MFRRVFGLTQAALWLLPASAAKNRLLRACGHVIGHRVAIGPILVLGCGRFVLGDEVNIAAANVFRDMSRVRLQRHVQIGSWNWFSAHPGYQNYSDEAGRLVVGAGTFITSRHYLDCSGAIEVGTWSAIAGQRSTFQTHEMDLMTNRTTVGRIRIGDRSFVGTGCILLRGAQLPSRSLLAAGSTLTRADGTSDTGLWAGSPARFVKPMPGKWFDRSEIHVDVVPFDAL
jgi:acetyltransferase-like isoleucine patch superfamily enzyme